MSRPPALSMEMRGCRNARFQIVKDFDWLSISMGYLLRGTVKVGCPWKSTRVFNVPIAQSGPLIRGDLGPFTFVVNSVCLQPADDEH